MASTQLENIDKIITDPKKQTTKKVLSQKTMEKLVMPFLNNKNHKFIVESCRVQNAGENVIGFIGDYYKIEIVIKEGSESKKLKYFMKSLPSDVSRADKIKEGGYFHRESNVYTKILSEFDKVQNSTEYHAKCPISTDLDIILEDLHENGYRTTNSRETFDRDHCQTALKSLAKFHAASWILEETRSKLLGEKFRIQDEFEDFLTECGYKYKEWFIACMKAALTSAGESEKYGKNTEYFEEVKLKWEAIFKQALELCCPSKNFRNVMCHRDLWANNLMFKYDNDTKPSNCTLVDFQTCRCMPPMGDVVSLLFLNLTRTQRQNYFEDLIQYYYTELDQELGLHGIAVEDIVTWKDFRSQCEVYKLWALIQCAILLQVTLLEPADVKEILSEADYDKLLNRRIELVMAIMKKDSVYKARLLDSVEELIELFCLNN